MRPNAYHVILVVVTFNDHKVDIEPERVVDVHVREDGVCVVVFVREEEGLSRNV